MLYLSRSDLRDMALQLLTDYYGTVKLPIKRLEADEFAICYMGLDVRYAPMTCAERTILGVIAYENTVIELDHGSFESNIPIKKRTVFLNDCLRKSGQQGRRNFTLVHECAHQAIYLLNPDTFTRCRYREQGRTYSLRELANADDYWSEWQANTLASELLMPEHIIHELLKRDNQGRKVRIYPEGRLLFPERRLTRNMSDFLGVSRSALLIRLKHLRLLDYRSQKEYLEAEELDSLIGGY